MLPIRGGRGPRQVLARLRRDGLRRGHKVVRLAGDGAPEHDAFDPDRATATIRSEHDRAIAEGHTGLSVVADMFWVLGAAPSDPELTAYERRLGDEARATLAVLCQYDQAQLAAGLLHHVAAEHVVDLSPELAAIGRRGDLTAARVESGTVLRLAGELDFEGAHVLAGILAAHFHGTLRFDLSDLTFIDVAGMRALRGRKAQPIVVFGARESFRRLLALMA